MWDMTLACVTCVGVAMNRAAHCNTHTLRNKEGRVLKISLVWVLQYACVGLHEYIKPLLYIHEQPTFMCVCDVHVCRIFMYSRYSCTYIMNSCTYSCTCIMNSCTWMSWISAIHEYPTHIHVHEFMMYVHEYRLYMNIWHTWTSHTHKQSCTWMSCVSDMSWISAIHEYLTHMTFMYMNVLFMCVTICVTHIHEYPTHMNVTHIHERHTYKWTSHTYMNIPHTYECHTYTWIWHTQMNVTHINKCRTYIHEHPTHLWMSHIQMNITRTNKRHTYK